MEEQLIKNLIDKMLVEDISDDENRYILEQIKNHSTLKAYYNETLSLKSNLQQIAETDAFTDSELNDSRAQLFQAIDGERIGLQWWHLAVAVLISVIGTWFFTSQLSTPQTNLQISEQTETFRQPINGNIVALNVNQINEDEIVFSGKSINEFNISGHKQDPQIQSLIQQTALNDPNISNRIKAIKMLDYSSKTDDILMSVIKDNSNNSIVRLNALQRLSETKENSLLASTYLNLLKKENDRLLQMQLIELLKSYQLNNQIFEEIQTIMNQSSDERLKHILKKEMLEI